MCSRTPTLHLIMSWYGYGGLVLCRAKNALAVACVLGTAGSVSGGRVWRQARPIRPVKKWVMSCWFDYLGHACALVGQAKRDSRKHDISLLQACVSSLRHPPAASAEALPYLCPGLAIFLIVQSPRGCTLRYSMSVHPSQNPPSIHSRVPLSVPCLILNCTHTPLTTS